MFLKGIYAGKPAIFQLTVLLLLILAGAVFSSLIVMGFFYMIYGLHADITQYSDMMRPRHIPLSCIGTCVAVQLQSERISVDRENA